MDIEVEPSGTRPYAASLPVTVNARWAEGLLLSLALTAVDLLAVLGGFRLAYTLRFETGLTWLYQHEVAPLDFYAYLVLFLAPIWIVVFRTFGLYDFRNLFAGLREYARVFNACTLGMMLVILFSFFYPSFPIARGWVVLSWLLVTLGALLGRFALRRIIQSWRARGRFLTSALIVGANGEGQAIAAQLRANPKAGVWIAGFVDDGATPGRQLSAGVPVLGSLDALPTLVRQHGIQDLIVASTALSREKLLELFQAFGTAEEITLRMSSGLYEIMTTGVEVQEIGNVPLLSVNKARLTGAELLLKRGLDLAVSGLALLLGWPLLAAIALAVRLDSPGPVFYRRQVVGGGGKLFDALKFRTMYIDADEWLARDPELRRQFEENYKLKDDPRITRVGCFLRRTSLDELPQLWNVFRGQMSLVGPRMITAKELSRYGKWRMNLATVKPGITGLWQVSGRSDVSYEDRVMLDMHYIRNYSIWLDLHLLWQTVPAVLRGHGAY
jgi:exopolysaccharide biosynthesis polyprenyl glycosylphosphotransferase